jgi:hypothetical protein
LHYISDSFLSFGKLAHNGVYVNGNATFTMNNGTISGNTTSYGGGGVTVEQ